MHSDEEILKLNEQIGKMMSTIDSYVDAKEKQNMKAGVSLADYISVTLGCDRKAAERFMTECLHAELDDIHEDTYITTLSESEIERMCLMRLRHYVGGWLCSWQRVFLVWTYYNKM